jgi:parvulin-like peptidyl-prolyl isomerase
MAGVPRMLNSKEIAMKKACLLPSLVCAALFAQIAFAQTAPATPVPDETVVAKVDGKNLTAGDVRKALADLGPDFGRLYQQDPKVAIQQMFVMRELAAEAEKAKLGEESPMKEQLEAMRANVLASAMLSHEHNYYNVSEEMIQESYQRNQAKYQQARIKLISIAFKPAISGVGASAGASLADIARAASEAAAGKTQRPEEDARKLAEDLVKQIRGGADFAKLVAQYSDDAASKAVGGDFGVVNANSAYSDEIKNAVLALKPAEVTNPLRQVSAFYIIRVEEKTAQSMREVSESIRQELRQAHVNEWFAAIRNRFIPVVENPEFFAPAARGPALVPGVPVVGAPAAGAK